MRCHLRTVARFKISLSGKQGRSICYVSATITFPPLLCFRKHEADKLTFLTTAKLHFHSFTRVLELGTRPQPSPSVRLCALVWSVYSRVSVCVLGIPYLYQRFLHGAPVGDSPGTLQYQVGVAVAFRLAVLSQRLPLVQLFRTAAETGRRVDIKMNTSSHRGGCNGTG
jgi:hypothetical protein